MIVSYYKIDYYYFDFDWILGYFDIDFDFEIDSYFVAYWNCLNCFVERID